MINDLGNENLICLCIEAIDWQDATQKICLLPVENGKIKPSYIEIIIQSALTDGSYFVLLPHAYPETRIIESAIT